MTATLTPPAPPRHLPGAGDKKYLANTPPGEVPIDQWVEQFNRDGYLFIQNVLPPEVVEELKRDLDRVLAETPDTSTKVIELHVRMFEKSAANVRLFDLEPIVTFAEKAVEWSCHVVHNNGFKTPPGGGISGWHQDDAPHYLVTPGTEPPTNVRLPCLLFTANYYLTDVDLVEHGPTQVVPGSHLFGAPVPSGGFAGEGPANALRGTKYEEKIVSCLGPAGSVVIFNNQVWHRGGPNTSDRTRYMAQVSYARRLVGHKYFPFMNYQMPEHVYRDANPRLKRLLGFLPSGAYG
jgi:ectoine hydroxylase-related dioxygenase (phytanoyl-CoA dioxygenase family)